MATLDQARTLDVPTARASRPWVGAKQASALYCMSLVAVRHSAQVTPMARQAGAAHVRIDGLLKGQRQQVMAKMRTARGRYGFGRP